MTESDKYKRLSILKNVPKMAAADHRHFLDEDGKDPRFEKLSRQERRKINANTRRLIDAYAKIAIGTAKSGAGFAVDKIVREMAIEYTHRYATSGVHTQPVSFNYFEPFCSINFIEHSIAPYAVPAQEVDHLFNIVDFLDYATSSAGSKFQLASLKTLPEGKIFHFTNNGDIHDFTFMTATGREFVVSGFSMIRRSDSLHWYLVGGEMYSESEWDELSTKDTKVDTASLSPAKRAFLEEENRLAGGTMGRPVPLEGTSTAKRTIISGETDLDSRHHLSRCHMSENEHTFNVACDDPDVLESTMDESLRSHTMEVMRSKISQSAVLWNLAETMFQLTEYFAFKVNIAKDIAVASGKQMSIRPTKRGRGIASQFRTVSCIEISDQPSTVVRSYIGPRYKTDTNGYWHRLQLDTYGRDADGNSVVGRTWIAKELTWRERPDVPTTIYVKSTIASAKIKEREYFEAVTALESNVTRLKGQAADQGVLYVLRCTTMKDQIYKVGWTSGTAEERAKELTTATGVATSFVVVKYWPHTDAEAVEKGVHAMLDPYRVSDNREFFEAPFSTIEKVIETEILRSNAKLEEHFSR